MNDSNYTDDIPLSCSGNGWIVRLDGDIESASGIVFPASTAGGIRKYVTAVDGTVGIPLSRDEIIQAIENVADQDYEEMHVSDNLLVAVPLEQSACERKVIYIELESDGADDCICVFDYEIDGLIRALQKAKAMLE